MLYHTNTIQILTNNTKLNKIYLETPLSTSGLLGALRAGKGKKKVACGCGLAMMRKKRAKELKAYVEAHGKHHFIQKADGQNHFRYMLYE